MLPQSALVTIPLALSYPRVSMVNIEFNLISSLGGTWSSQDHHHLSTKSYPRHPPQLLLGPLSPSTFLLLRVIFYHCTCFSFIWLYSSTLCCSSSLLFSFSFVFTLSCSLHFLCMGFLLFSIDNVPHTILSSVSSSAKSSSSQLCLGE